VLDYWHNGVQFEPNYNVCTIYNLLELKQRVLVSKTKKCFKQKVNRQRRSIQSLYWGLLQDNEGHLVHISEMSSALTKQCLMLREEVFCHYLPPYRNIVILPYINKPGWCWSICSQHLSLQWLMYRGTVAKRDLASTFSRRRWLWRNVRKSTMAGELVQNET